MHKKPEPSFKKMKAQIYSAHKEGFYVYTKPNDCEPHKAVKYISHYMGRPPIASSRIDHYDGESVSFHYGHYEDGRQIYETLPALDFIQKLLLHLPHKNFKLTRYYGLYAVRTKHKYKHTLRMAVPKEKHVFFRSLASWRTFICFSFHQDSLKCSCGHTVPVLDIYYKKTTLYKLYQKAMNSS